MTLYRFQPKQTLAQKINSCFINKIRKLDSKLHIDNGTQEQFYSAISSSIKSTVSGNRVLKNGNLIDAIEKESYTVKKQFRLLDYYHQQMVQKIDYLIKLNKEKKLNCFKSFSSLLNAIAFYFQYKKEHKKLIQSSQEILKALPEYKLFQSFNLSNTKVTANYFLSLVDEDEFELELIHRIYNTIN